VLQLTPTVTTHMEEEDHFTQTLLSLLSHCCTLPLAAPHFLSCSLTFSSLHSLILLSHVCLFIGKYGGCINGASTWVAPFCQWLVQLPLTMATLSS
jgi:hypothetical protein